MPGAPLLRLAALLGLLGMPPTPAAAQTERVDLALVLAVDVSESVDGARYTLQMDGIAAALEAREVQASILSGPHQSMLIALVQWSSRPALSLPWTLLTSAGDVQRFAARVRRLRRASNGFTCMSAALRSIADKLLTQLPVPAERIVVDVSGDGQENCNPPEIVDRVRDELAGAGVTVNGLPILEGDEAATLEAWYQDHLIGGPNAFLVPAESFDDFDRAIRRKFVTEISMLPTGSGVREAARQDHAGRRLVADKTPAPEAQPASCRARSSAPRQAPSSFASIMRAFSSSAFASDIRSFGPAPLAWPGPPWPAPP